MVSAWLVEFFLTGPGAAAAITRTSPCHTALSSLPVSRLNLGFRIGFRLKNTQERVRQNTIKLLGWVISSAQWLLVNQPHTADEEASSSRHTIGSPTHAHMAGFGGGRIFVLSMFHS